MKKTTPKFRPDKVIDVYNHISMRSGDDRLMAAEVTALAAILLRTLVEMAVASKDKNAKTFIKSTEQYLSDPTVREVEVTLLQALDSEDIDEDKLN